MYEFLERVHPEAAQDFSVGGRIAWAIYCHDVGRAAVESGNMPVALTTLREAIRAFPFPLSLELLGECLLLEGKPVEAVVYLAAAVGMSEEYQFHQLFLLGKALAAAHDNYVSKIILKKALTIEQNQEAQELLGEVINRSKPVNEQHP